MKGDEGRLSAAVDAARAGAEQEWARAWSGRYASRPARRRGSARVGPGKVAVVVGALLGLLIAPLAIAQGEGSGDDPQATAARTGDVLREGIRNPRRSFATRETQIISAVSGERYGTRQSNARRGPNAGGAAIYGCRRPTRECTRHVNLAGGPAAHFSAQGDGAVPFTVDENATGMVTGLNAERLGGFTAVQLATAPAGGHLAGNYPNPTLAPDAPGVALAGVHVTAAGAIRSFFNRFGGAPTVANIAAGRYGISFPGLTLNQNDFVHQASIIGGSFGFIRPRSPLAGNALDIEVRTANANATLTNRAFSYTVFGATTP